MIILKKRHLFGPVPSRRLGVSLGIDLVPHKTCSLDCVYCECGKTTNLTVERKEFVPTAEIIEELDNYLKKEPELDYITYSGSGEPILHSGIGEISNFLKDNYPQYKIALLTNGTLFTDKSLINEVKRLDLIVPSLDAVSDNVFTKINRPHKNLDNSKIIEGLVQLSKKYEGEIWLEIFIVPGINDSNTEIEAMLEVIDKINPDKVQLNSLDRPGTESWVEKADLKTLENIAAKIGDKAEIIADFKSRKEIKSFSESLKDDILDMIKRRPCTLHDLSTILGIHENEVNKYLQLLIEEEDVSTKTEDRGTFYYWES